VLFFIKRFLLDKDIKTGQEQPHLEIMTPIMLEKNLTFDLARKLIEDEVR